MNPLEALQATLAAEHAAVYTYGAVGARTSASGEPRLYAAMVARYRVHRRRRDQLTAMVTGRGGVPVASEVDYEVTAALGTAPELNDAALQVERRIARTYSQLVESTAGAERRWALVALDDAAASQVEFRGTPEMFPGTT